MRYLPLTDADRSEMLAVIGAASVEDLFAETPHEARLKGLLDLPLHASEIAVERALSTMAWENRAAGQGPFFCGAGAYRHHVPASVDHIIQRSEFLTSYTPYQPEISQGTLQTLFEFQTQVSELLGLPVANASMWDGSTACAEAVMMAARATGRKKAVLSGALHPHYAASTRTLAHSAGIEVRRLAPAASLAGEEDLASEIDEETACVVVQNPDVFGRAHELRPIADAARSSGALLIGVVTETVSLGLLKSPGARGADIAAAEGASIGVGLNFGGPYVG
ncbi:MAG: glycine dehydrogenase, partial [Caulobacteraceae bacterium]